MASKPSGASATGSSASNRLCSLFNPLVRLADRFGRRASLPRATVEVAFAAAAIAVLFRRLNLDPTNQSTLAFVTVASSCVFLGAFRLSRSRVSFSGVVRECEGLAAILIPTLAAQYWIHTFLQGVGPDATRLMIAMFFADLAVYVVGRFLVVVLPWWLRFNQQKLRWQLVQAHITVVLIICSLPMAIIMIVLVRNSSLGMGYESGGPVENVVLRLAYLVIPALAAVVTLLGFALMVIIVPSIALSYVVARRMTRRLETLAAATTAIREGDYSARVPAQGSDEVAQLQVNFNAMATVLERSIAETAAERDKIARLLDLRRELVASVSHELRTPLTIIRGYLDSTLAQEGDLPAELRSDLAVMHGEALRLQRLIDDLFALSRAEVGALTFHPRSTDIGALIDRCGRAASASAWRAQRVEIVVESAANLPAIEIDPDRLEQILFNLINNAVRHSPPGGLIHLSAARDGHEMRIDVADTGEGIPADELPLIWDRFYRGSNSKDARGSGIGLSVVRELTESMGGTVAVASVVGEGTRFTLRFPIDEADLAVDGPTIERIDAQETARLLPANAQH